MNVRLRYALFFLGAYLLFLAASLPAAQLYQWSAQSGALPVQLYQLSGTLWRGRAATMRMDGLSLDGPAWTFRPAALLLGRVEFGLDATLGSGTLETVAGRTLGGAAYAHELRLAAPIRELAAITGEPDMGLTGRLSAQIDRLRVDGGLLRQLDGRLDVSGAGMGPPLNVALGGFTVAFETDRENGAFNGTLKDTGGPLQAEGTITLQPDGVYVLNARLAAREPGGNGLAQALSMLGRPGPDGRIAVTQSGRIPLDRYLRPG